MRGKCARQGHCSVHLQLRIPSIWDTTWFRTFRKVKTPTYSPPKISYVSPKRRDSIPRRCTVISHENGILDDTAMLTSKVACLRLFLLRNVRTATNINHLLRTTITEDVPCIASRNMATGRKCPRRTQAFLCDNPAVLGETR
jgi:hypothetical protein